MRTIGEACGIPLSALMHELLQQPDMVHQLGVSFLRNARSAVWSDIDALSKAEEASTLLRIFELEYVQDLQAILSVKYEV